MEDEWGKITSWRSLTPPSAITDSPSRVDTNIQAPTASVAVCIYLGKSVTFLSHYVELSKLWHQGNKVFGESPGEKRHQNVKIPFFPFILPFYEIICFSSFCLLCSDHLFSHHVPSGEARRLQTLPWGWELTYNVQTSILDPRELSRCLIAP